MIIASVRSSPRAKLSAGNYDKPQYNTRWFQSQKLALIIVASYLRPQNKCMTNHFAIIIQSVHYTYYAVFIAGLFGCIYNINTYVCMRGFFYIFDRWR